MAPAKTIFRTYTHKAYLSRAGHRNLDDLLGHLTGLWNLALDQRKRLWENEQRALDRYTQHMTVTRMRQRHPDTWGRFSVLAQRSVLNRLDRSYRRFFAVGGYPRFKSKHRGVRSFQMRCPMVRTNGKWSWVKIKGIGRIRFRGDPPEGLVRRVRLVRTARRVKVQFVVEHTVEIEPDTRPMVGVDLGITSRIALSTGETVPGVKLDRAEIKRRQRRLTKAKRGSRNRRKRVLEVRREWQRVAEREKGALHELTTRLVRDVSASFAVEDLKIKNMVKNRRLSRSITEQQWGAFTHMLAYKAESAGGRVVKVPPRHTSQTCHVCGWRPSESIGLGVRRYRCGDCGQTSDRDVNAARNVLQKGMALTPGGDPPGRAEQVDKRSLVAASA